MAKSPHFVPVSNPFQLSHHSKMLTPLCLRVQWWLSLITPTLWNWSESALIPPTSYPSSFCRSWWTGISNHSWHPSGSKMRIWKTTSSPRCIIMVTLCSFTIHNILAFTYKLLHALKQLGLLSILGMWGMLPITTESEAWCDYRCIPKVSKRPAWVQKPT